jgi:lipoprotein-anchoring transpeptidase ErfK/SrfK
MKKLLAAITLSFIALTTAASAASITADINVSSQTMIVRGEGISYRWLVSTAMKGMHTPTGHFRPIRLDATHKSKKYHNSPMPYSVFFDGGVAIHGTYSIKHLGHRASHGCVRLAPANAQIFFNLVKEVGKNNVAINIE